MTFFARLLTTLVLCWTACTAQAALFEDDEARRAILELRQRLDNSQEEARRASEETGQLRRSLLDLQNQIEALRAELARQQGQSEQLARSVADMQRQQKDQLQPLEERLRKLEPVKVAVDGREFMAEPGEKRDFEMALGVFRKGDFAAAQTAFADFLRRMPLSGYAPSALFWLGNARYATREYKEAIQSFRTLLTQAPDHLRAPEAVLSIANCQLELKDQRGARKTLDELIKAYPESEAAATAKDRLTRLK